MLLASTANQQRSKRAYYPPTTGSSNNSKQMPHCMAFSNCLHSDMLNYININIPPHSSTREKKGALQ